MAEEDWGAGEWLTCLGDAIQQAVPGSKNSNGQQQFAVFYSSQSWIIWMYKWS